MRGKILFVVGAGVGYVLGAKAGRERYAQIRSMAAKLWEDPHVQKRVNNAEEFVRDHAPEVVGFLADGAKTVAAKVSGRSTRARSAKKTTSRSSTKSPSSPKSSAKASSGSAESSE